MEKNSNRRTVAQPDEGCTVRCANGYRYDPYAFDPLRGVMKTSVAQSHNVAPPSRRLLQILQENDANEQNHVDDVNEYTPALKTVSEKEEQSMNDDLSSTDSSIIAAQSQSVLQSNSSCASEPAYVTHCENLMHPPENFVGYAAVDFRFGSAWFLLPMDVAVGSIVVVHYPVKNTLHMGLVSAVTTVKPPTFYTSTNKHPVHLSKDEIRALPRVVRVADDQDMELKIALRSHDNRSLQTARLLAAELEAPIEFLDAEWMVNLTVLTLSVRVHEEYKYIDYLAALLASKENAEVIFTLYTGPRHR